MKKSFGLAAAFTLVSSLLAWGGVSTELAGIGTIYIPEDDETYEAGAGIEIQARFWVNPYLGFALAGGSASYAIDEQDIYIREPGLSVNGELEGDVALAPFGVSLLVRPLVTERLSLTLEGGVRYVMVESDAELELDVVEPGSRTFVRDEVDIDDGVVAVAMATLDIVVAEQVTLFGGAGWQFDLEKGDVEFFDIDLGENRLEAFLIQAGAGVRF